MKRTALFLFLSLGAIGVVVGFTVSTTAGAILAGLGVLGAVAIGGAGDTNPPGTYGP